MIVDEFKSLNEKLKCGFISPQQFSEQWDELVKRKKQIRKN